MNPASFTRFLLIRHGEVEARYHRVFGGVIDMELSPFGHDQVKALADYLKRTEVNNLYVSPMKRVAQTAAPLARLLAKEPVVLEGLREVDFGAWTGLSWEQVQERFQISAFEWLNQLELGAISGAESTATFRERTEACLQQILADSPDKTVAVVCHGGVIRMILAVLLDLPFRKLAAFDIEYASLTHVHYRPGKVEVQLLNFTPWRDL